MKWLYDSQGFPIAFIEEDEVFSPVGEFIGKILKNEVYNGYYKGEIIDERFVVNRSKKYKYIINGSSANPRKIPNSPALKRRIELPQGLEDIEMNIEN